MSIQPPWSDRLAEPLPRDHVVQLYRDERALVDAVALFAGVGIGKGEAVILVATSSHLEAIERRLEADGFDVGDLKHWGQLTVRDASELLSHFMVEGVPDAVLFKALIGDVIDRVRVSGRYRKVRVYGEMVNLLWQQNLSAAIRLEQLWNEVIASRCISLFCAYGLRGDAPNQLTPALRAVHSHLIPIEASA